MRRVVLLVFGCLLSTMTGLRPAHGTVLDLNTPGSWGTINGAIFQQFSDGGAGSGNIDAFVRIQANPVEQGYNTDYRPVQFDEDNSSTFNHSLLLSEVPTVTDGGTTYRELLLDIDQSARYISLDKLEVYLEATDNIGLYPDNFTTLVYDLDAGEDSWIKLDYTINAGSGAGDMLAYIPDDYFKDEFGVYLNDYVYVYSKFGENFAADNGFEEWAHGVGGPVIPEPATILLFGISGLLVLRHKRGA
jgi:hypothetical protein